MAKFKSVTIKPTPAKQEDVRPVEIHFNRLNKSHRQPTNQLLHFICVPLMVFSVLGLTWAIPFPQFKFLAAYQGYFNWASFVIAFWVYYTLKLSPVLSYLMLFVLFGFSYGVMQLSLWEQAGGIPLIWVSTLFFGLAWLGQFIGGNIEGNKQSFEDDKQLVLITPIWVLHFLAKKIRFKY